MAQPTMPSPDESSYPPPFRRPTSPSAAVLGVPVAPPALPVSFSTVHIPMVIQIKMAATRFLHLHRRLLARAPALHLLPHLSQTCPLIPPLAPLLPASGCLLPSLETGWGSRRVSYGAVNLVISDGKPKFEAQEVDPTRKERYRTKKRLKLQRKREKRKRKEANRRDPRCIRVKGKKKKPRFPDAEARLKYKIEKAKMKEALLVEKLKNYEVPKVQGPTIKPEEVTGEERFYLKKMAQKSSNYVPLGRRGVFGGVVLNMHLHWKKHETVKVICKPCKPGQVHEYARELARLSGGTPIQTIGNDTIVFYRGKNYTQPEVMSPVDTLSKKRALEKSKYEQSLETVRHFIAVSEKELELYYQHIALYGDPRCRASDSSLVDQSNECEAGILEAKDKGVSHQIDAVSTDISELETDTDDEQLLHAQTDYDTEQCSNTNIDLEGDTGVQEDIC